MFLRFLIVLLSQFGANIKKNKISAIWHKLLSLDDFTELAMMEGVISVLPKKK